MRNVKILCGVLVLYTALWLYPVEAKEVGQLQPVALLVASMEDGDVVLDGGSGLVGRGETWALAMDDLEAAAVGTPFFGTTSAVVLGDSRLVEPLLAEPRLRPAASVYLGGGAWAELATYLAEKHGTVTIQDLKIKELEGGYVRIPTILETGGGYRIGG